MNIEIKKLEPELIDDFVRFFEETAFQDNPEWSGCFCYYYHVPNNEIWFKRTYEQNKKDAVEAIKAERLNGFLAYYEGCPVGWCNADCYENYSRLKANKEISIEKNLKVGCLTCFIVALNYRRKGVAKKLLCAVCDDFYANKYDYIETYPYKNPKNDAENYHGPMTLYENNGFEKYKELKEFIIMRKKLQ